LKDLRLGLFLIISAWFLSACGQNGLYHLSWITGGEHTLSGSIPGDLVVLNGKVSLLPGSQVQGSLHLLSGKATLGGEVQGDVSYLGGELILGPDAHIRGDLNLGGGAYLPSPTAQIDGEVRSGTGIGLPDLPEQTASSGLERVTRALVSGVLLGGLAVFMRNFAASALQRVGDCIVSHGLVSGSMGLLVGVVGLSLFITIAYTILLIPVTLLGLFVLGAAIVYGWAAMGVLLGSLGLHLLKRQETPRAAAFLGGLGFFLLLEIVSSLPFVGGLIGIGVALVGLGAVFLTRFGLRQFVPASAGDEYLTT
jgi:hypothetical protein